MIVTWYAFDDDEQRNDERQMDSSGEDERRRTMTVIYGTKRCGIEFYRLSIYFKTIKGDAMPGWRRYSTQPKLSNQLVTREAKRDN